MRGRAWSWGLRGVTGISYIWLPITPVCFSLAFLPRGKVTKISIKLIKLKFQCTYNTMSSPHTHIYIPIKCAMLHPCLIICVNKTLYISRKTTHLALFLQPHANRCILLLKSTHCLTFNMSGRGKHKTTARRTVRLELVGSLLTSQRVDFYDRI